MTDRVSGFMVTLRKDLREDDAQEVAGAIALLSGVLSVSEIPAEPINENLWAGRCKREIVRRILEEGPRGD